MTRLKLEYRTPVLIVAVFSGPINSGNISCDAIGSNNSKAAAAVVATAAARSKCKEEIEAELRQSKLKLLHDQPASHKPT